MAGSTVGAPRRAPGAAVGSRRGTRRARRRSGRWPSKSRCQTSSSAPLVGQLDGVVLAVVVEALEASHVADLGLGHDHALEARRAPRCGQGATTGWIEAMRSRSRHRHDADEATVVDHGDVAVAVLGEGRRRPPARGVPGATTSGSPVIHSATFDAPGSTPAAPQRTRSRSVRIPIGRSPSTTTTEPDRRVAHAGRRLGHGLVGQGGDHRRAHQLADGRDLRYVVRHARRLRPSAQGSVRGRKQRFTRW